MRPGQCFHEYDLARMLVRVQAIAHELLEFLLQAVALLLRHDVGHGLHQAMRVLNAHDRRLDHILVLQQATFDVGRRKYEGRDNSLLEEASQWLAGALRQRRPDLSTDDCDQRAFIATRAAHALCLTASTDRPEWLRQPAFRSEILKLVMPYLKGPG